MRTGGLCVKKLSHGNENRSFAQRSHLLATRVVGSDPIFFVISMLWGAVLIRFAVIRYTHGFATAFDLGSTAQSLYLISHGHWLAFNTYLGKPTLLDINSYILYILAWPFRFFGGIYFLLALQIATLVIFARAAYDYILYRAESRSTAWLFGVLALLSPALIGGIMFDFHVDFIVLLGLSIALFSLLHTNRLGFFIGITIALLSKNTAALPIGTWALVELILPHTISRRMWWVTGIMAATVFIFDEKILPAIFGSSGPSHLAIFSQYGNSATAVAINLLQHPAIVAGVIMAHSHYLVEMAGSWGFLPLVSGLYVLPFMVLIVLNDLSNNPALRSLATQYSVIIAFFGALATGHALSFKSAVKKASIWTGGLIGLAISMFLLKGLWTTEILPQTGYNPPAAAEFQMASRINHLSNAAVWTTNHLGALVYPRSVVGIDAYEGIDTLFQQRRHLAPGSPIILFMPRGDSNLDVNETVWQGLTHHYQITGLNAVAISLKGTKTFPAYGQFAYNAAAAENSFHPLIPAYLPAVLANVTSSKVSSSGWLTASKPGIMAVGLPIALPIGTYRVTFVIHAGARVHGSLVSILSQSSHRVLAQHMVTGKNTASITLSVHNSHPRWIITEVHWNGFGTLRYFGIIVTKVGTHS